MTYDVEFVPGPAPADDDWGPNLDAAADVPVGALAVAAWPAIAERVRVIIPGAAEHGEGDLHQIGDEATGLHLTVGPDELSLAVPYWHQGDEAAAIERTLAAVVAVVEEATGLLAFDPQSGRGFVADGPAATLDRTTRAVADRPRFWRRRW